MDGVKPSFSQQIASWKCLSWYSECSCCIDASVNANHISLLNINYIMYIYRCSVVWLLFSKGVEVELFNDCWQCRLFGDFVTSEFVPTIMTVRLEKLIPLPSLVVSAKYTKQHWDMSRNICVVSSSEQALGKSFVAAVIE